MEHFSWMMLDVYPYLERVHNKILYIVHIFLG